MGSGIFEGGKFLFPSFKSYPAQKPEVELNVRQKGQPPAKKSSIAKLNVLSYGCNVCDNNAVTGGGLHPVISLAAHEGDQRVQLLRPHTCLAFDIHMYVQAATTMNHATPFCMYIRIYIPVRRQCAFFSYIGIHAPSGSEF